MAVDKFLLSDNKEEDKNNIAVYQAQQSVPPVNNIKTNPVGKPVPINDINWKDNKKTLVMYLSTKCRFCTESGEFYKKLVEKNSSQNVGMVAVMPQSLNEGKIYLENLGVDVKQVRSSRLNSIGISGTPTLLLVNEDGIVSEIWRGKLSADKEEILLKRLFG